MAAREVIGSDPMDEPNAHPIVSAPGALPLLGHTTSLLRDPLAFLSSLSDLGHDLVRIRLGPLTAVVVCDPELTHRVLRDDRTFDKGGPLFDVARRVVGNNAITCPHDLHRRQRRLIQPTFHHRRITTYAAAMSNEIDDVTSGWRDGQVLDVRAEMLQITTRTFMATMFSGSLTPEVLTKALSDVTTIVNGIYHRMVTPPLLGRLPTIDNLRYLRAGAGLRAAIDAIVVDRRKNGDDYGDLLSALLMARDTGDDGVAVGLTDTEIRDQLTAFFIAGAETTASALAWALDLLTRHPDVQERLHTETVAVLGASTARFEHLPELTLADHVVSETLRLYPPGWLFTRTVRSETVLGEHVLPAGTTVIYSPYLIQHRGDLYERPEQFEPSRWDIARTPADRKAFIAFGAGPRRCVGDTFAHTEAVLAVATVAARWQLHARPGGQTRPAIAMALHPRDLRIMVKSRHPPAGRSTTENQRHSGASA